MTGTAILITAAVLVAAGAIQLARWRFRRIALRAFHRSRGRIDRFKLTRKAYIRETLLADDAIPAAVAEQAAEADVDGAATCRRVEEYIDEIVPFFNILTYYQIGLVVS